MLEQRAVDAAGGAGSGQIERRGNQAVFELFDGVDEKAVHAQVDATARLLERVPPGDTDTA